MSKYNKCQNLTCFLLDVKAALSESNFKVSNFKRSYKVPSLQVKQLVFPIVLFMHEYLYSWLKSPYLSTFRINFYIPFGSIKESFLILFFRIRLTVGNCTFGTRKWKIYFVSYCFWGDKCFDPNMFLLRNSNFNNITIAISGCHLIYFVYGLHALIVREDLQIGRSLDWIFP